MTDQDFGGNLFQQMMETYVVPEVERRQENGHLPTPASLGRAQIVFYPDDRPIGVRVNDEIRGVAECTLQDGSLLRAGEPVAYTDIERLDSFMLDESDDADCGHVTMIHLATGWQIFFDFRYNRALSGRHLAIAREFLESARDSLDSERLSPFVDNLFSACELAAKALLLVFPDPAFRAKTNHVAIKSRFNKAAQVGNASKEHASIFNRLANLRRPARYLNGELDLREGEGIRLLQEAGDLIRSTEEFYTKGTL